MTEDQTQPAQPEASPEEQPVQSGLIAFVEPAGPEALTAFVEPAVDGQAPTNLAPPEEPKPEVAKETTPEPNAMQMAEIRHAADTEDAKREFAAKVLAARAPVPHIPQTQPVAPRILSQTLAEQEAGRKMNEHHAAFRANAPQPRRDLSEGTNTPVFRPNNYVPDQRKGQGNVGARTL